MTNQCCGTLASNSEVDSHLSRKQGQMLTGCAFSPRFLVLGLMISRLHFVWIKLMALLVSVQSVFVF